MNCLSNSFSIYFSNLLFIDVTSYRAINTCHDPSTKFIINSIALCGGNSGTSLEKKNQGTNKQEETY